MSADELPLLPLHTVLFPGAELRLRIFEARYLDLVRMCTRESRTFGVCQILEGSEVGQPATPAAVGTHARIVDFNAQPDGVLGIVVRGESRFHVRRIRVRDNGLIVAAIEPLADDTADAIEPEHGLLVLLLDRLIGHAGGPYASAARACFDQPDWVSYRLAELLPFDAEEKQRLLQCVDGYERLQRLVAQIPRLQGE